MYKYSYNTNAISITDIMLYDRISFVSARKMSCNKIFDKCQRGTTLTDINVQLSCIYWRRDDIYQLFSAFLSASSFVIYVCTKQCSKQNKPL